MKKLLSRVPTKKTIKLPIFFVGLSIIVATLFLGNSFAQSTDAPSGVAPAKAVNQNAPDEKPPSMKENVQVMVELTDVPAAVPYGQALKAARAQAEAERTAALANPKSAKSQAILNHPKKVEISAADNARVESHAQHLDYLQQGLLPSLTSGDIKGKVLFRTQHAYNGIAMVVSPANLKAISQLPGVKAVHEMHPKYLSNTFSDIDFLKARTTSGPAGPWNNAVLGDNIKVADIDSGLDYVHANFGGNGDYTGVTDTNANGHFPSAKVPGGIDLVGDAYNANDPNSVPVPDTNPMDCGGHGTGTASLIAGFGENNDGSTYTGTYDASNPAISDLKIAPGLAPHALLYPVRVFGCSGSTNVVVQAIDWAVANHMDVINMSLGSNEGYPDDPDAIAASNASAAGLLVASAAGNAGDSYYIHSSPASAPGTLSVAASFNDQSGFIADSKVTANSPGSIAGMVFHSIYGSPSSHATKTGNVIYAVPNNAATDGAAGGTTPLSNAAQISGNIALIDRGTSSFVDKCRKAQAAGAIAVIVDNFNNPTADPIVMGLDSTITIPCVMISKADRDTINTAAGGFNATTGVPANTVNVTIAPDNFVVAHGGAAPDTMPSYSSRGPGLPDSALKPDVTAPAEVVGVAVVRSGTAVANFNGTSSATPHVAGTMALLRQLHPTWSVQELNALVCSTATHDLIATTAGGGAGVGRVGAGRIDLANAANSEVVAYNGSGPNQMGVSFGVVETPVNGSSSLTKDITVVNKGASSVTYNLSIQDNPALPGATFSVTPSSITVPAASTGSFQVKLTVTGNLLKHRKETGVSFQLPAVVGRQWLTEAGGYAVLAPTAGATTTLRVAIYAAPKPVSAMHTTATNFVVRSGSTGTVSLPLAGTGVNTGPNYGLGFDIKSLVKAFELQYAGTGPSTDPNVIKYVGVMSDYGVGGKKPGDTILVFGIEGFGNAPVPEFNASDKEVYIDTNHDGTLDFAIFLTSIPNGTAHSNEYRPVLVDLKTGAQTPIPFPYETNLLDPVFNPDGSVGGRDTNSFNNSSVLIPVPAAMLMPATSHGGGAPTKIDYLVATFDRTGTEVDETPLMSFDFSKPGLAVSGGKAEPFYYDDLPGGTIPVKYDARNFKANGTLGVWLVHRHNADGLRSDVVTFSTK